MSLLTLYGAELKKKKIKQKPGINIFSAGVL